MILAARTNAIESVKLLISYGANINHVNEVGKSALMSAASTGKVEIVKYLFEEQKAEIETKTSLGLNAHFYAILENQFEVYDYLCEVRPLSNQELRECLQIILKYRNLEMLKRVLNKIEADSPLFEYAFNLYLDYNFVEGIAEIYGRIHQSHSIFKNQIILTKTLAVRKCEFIDYNNFYKAIDYSNLNLLLLKAVVLHKHEITSSFFDSLDDDTHFFETGIGEIEEFNLIDSEETKQMKHGMSKLLKLDFCYLLFASLGDKARDLIEKHNIFLNFVFESLTKCSGLLKSFLTEDSEKLFELFCSTLHEFSPYLRSLVLRKFVEMEEGFTGMDELTINGKSHLIENYFRVLSEYGFNSNYRIVTFETKTRCKPNDEVKERVEKLKAVKSKLPELIDSLKEVVSDKLAAVDNLIGSGQIKEAFCLDANYAYR